MRKELLILGVDPGVTVGYVVIDLNGQLVTLNSSRYLNVPRLTITLTMYGKIVVVGCDVNPPSKFVKEVARRTGSTIIVPEANLTIKEKKKLIGDYKKIKINNKHEKDALASAVFAFKKIKQLLTKVDVILEKRYDPKMSNEVKKMLLTRKGLTIERAVKKIVQNDYF